MVNGDRYLLYAATLTKSQKSQVRIGDKMDAVTKRRTERSNDT